MEAIVATAGSPELGELAQYAAAFVAVAVASGWLTVRVLRRRSCGGACARCDRAELGECSSDAKSKDGPAAPSRGIRSPDLQVLQGKR